MKIVSWNIRAGGGKRAAGIVAQLQRWRPDLIALSEFRGTPASQSISAALAASGWSHQLQTCLPEAPAVNALLLASRSPLQRMPNPAGVVPAERWLHAQVGAGLAVLLVHVPNRVTGLKFPFLDAISHWVTQRADTPGLVLGDTNTGRMGIDEESSAFVAREDAWMQAMAAAGWPDGFRYRHPRARQFSWYSPNGDNGFRLDQAFVQTSLLAHLVRCEYRWGGAGSGRSTYLSDHAALLVGMHGGSFNEFRVAR